MVERNPEQTPKEVDLMPIEWGEVRQARMNPSYIAATMLADRGVSTITPHEWTENPKDENFWWPAVLSVRTDYRGENVLRKVFGNLKMQALTYFYNPKTDNDAVEKEKLGLTGWDEDTKRRVKALRPQSDLLWKDKYKKHLENKPNPNTDDIQKLLELKREIEMHRSQMMSILQGLPALSEDELVGMIRDIVNNSLPNKD